MGDGEGETMENWDETKLKEVVDMKHAAEKNNATTIICKYFVEAVEKSLYGWFWACPNGEKCIYRHALPPGYVLKKDKKKDDKKDELSLEELIETERSALGSATTKVTLESFLAWKKRKIEEKKLAQLEEEKKKMKDFKSGKQFGISGRDLFSFNPDLINDEDDEGGAAMDFIRERDENEDEFKEIDFSAFQTGPKEVNAVSYVVKFLLLFKNSFRLMAPVQLRWMTALVNLENLLKWTKIILNLTVSTKLQDPMKTTRAPLMKTFSSMKI